VTDPGQDLIDALAADPLFQLSTAGQEQFHTNMLYWLIESTAAADPLFQRVFRILPPQSIYKTTVAREMHHIDLIVDSGMGCGKLVLENKLHSIPNSKQLQGYHRDLPDRWTTNETQFVLLSLIAPNFELPEPWRRVDYSDLIDPLAESARSLKDTGSTFGADLIGHYVELLRRLIALRDRYTVEAIIDRAVIVPAADRTRLQAARLLPLVEKLQISALAALIGDRTDLADLETGLTRTHGVVEHFAVAPSGQRFGWQYQNGQMRLAVRVVGEGVGDRAERERVVASNYLDFFQWPSTDALDGGKKGRVEWQGFEPDFLYRYRGIRANTTYRELTEVCAQLTAHVDSYTATH
jgi:hypothetical protein